MTPQTNEKRREYHAERRKRQWDVIAEAKNNPCSRCSGVFPSYVMDLHHRDPSTKLFSIGVGGCKQSMSKLIAELEKCDVYCANCHRIIEYEARTGS